MDFLKSAVASAISKGPPFPYNFGERVDLNQSIWTLYNGTKRVGESSELQRIRLIDTTLRKMAPIAAFSPLTSPRTSPDSQSQRTV